MQKIRIVLLGSLILILGAGTIFAYHNSSVYSPFAISHPQFAIRNSKFILPCPECACWTQWLQLQQRSYMDSFASLPKKEKIITVCDYQVFLTSVQVLPNTFELLIYAQNPKTNKPYIKPKSIAVYMQTLNNSTPLLNIKDNNVVSEIRYVNPDPGDYWVKVALEDESGCPLTAETCFVLGSPPPNLLYMVPFGGLIISVFILVLYLRRKRKLIS